MLYNTKLKEIELRKEKNGNGAKKALQLLYKHKV